MLRLCSLEAGGAREGAKEDCGLKRLVESRFHTRLWSGHEVTLILAPLLRKFLRSICMGHKHQTGHFKHKWFLSGTLGFNDLLYKYYCSSDWLPLWRPLSLSGLWNCLVQLPHSQHHWLWKSLLSQFSEWPHSNKPGQPWTPSHSMCIKGFIERNNIYQELPEILPWSHCLSCLKCLSINPR